MLKLGVLGANGFIGSRLVETFHLEGLADVRPIVRNVSGVSRLARFDLDYHVGNALDRSSLRTAFKGCDVVVHAVAGDRKTILRSVERVYRAAQGKQPLSAQCHSLVERLRSSAHRYDARSVPKLQLLTAFSSCLR